MKFRDVTRRGPGHPAPAARRPGVGAPLAATGKLFDLRSFLARGRRGSSVGLTARRNQIQAPLKPCGGPYAPESIGFQGKDALGKPFNPGASAPCGRQTFMWGIPPEPYLSPAAQRPKVSPLSARAARRGNI